MNPIIVIGLVSVVTAGMYAAYDGLERQAALAALHADMLARQHAAHTTYVSGVIEEKRHVIISNNGPQAAELIQIRAYDNASALLNTWEMSYVLPPLRDFNVSSATAPAPPSNLTGSALEDSLDDGDYYRGVTSAGSIFEIERASGGTETPDGAYAMSAMPLTGGGGSASHAGGVVTTAYYYAHPPVDCDYHYVKPGVSRTYYVELVLINSPAYATSTSGPGTPLPTGTQTWYAETAVGTGSDRSGVPACSTYKVGLSAVPPGTNPQPGYGNVYNRTLSTTGTAVSLSLPVSGKFTAASDGDMLLRVEVPITAEASIHADGSTQLSNVNLTPTSCHGFVGDSRYVQTDQNLARTTSSWGSDFGSPIINGIAKIRVNGAPADTVNLPNIKLVGDTRLTNINFATQTGSSGGYSTCIISMTADIDGSWRHAGILTGGLAVNAAEGDVIEIDGTVSLGYAPPSVSGAAVDTTNARLELGDAVIVMGTLPP